MRPRVNVPALVSPLCGNSYNHRSACVIIVRLWQGTGTHLCEFTIYILLYRENQCANEHHSDMFTACYLFNENELSSAPSAHWVWRIQADAKGELRVIVRPPRRRAVPAHVVVEVEVHAPLHVGL